MALLDTFLMYFQYPFVRRALIVGVLISICAALMGVTLVLKRLSFIGDGLSHMAFGVMCVAGVMHLSNDMLLVLPITILSAVFLLAGQERMKLKGDAAVALMSVSSLAVGYLLINIFSASANVSGDVCTSLFGSVSILTLTQPQVYLSLFLSVFVIAVYTIFYNCIFAVTFDEAFAQSTGLCIKRYRLIIAVIIAVIIVLAMKLVGSLLISALIIFPALSAMRLFKNYRGVVICSVFISVLCSLLGMITAIIAGTPVGSTITAANIIAFLICCAIGGKI